MQPTSQGVVARFLKEMMEQLPMCRHMASCCTIAICGRWLCGGRGPYYFLGNGSWRKGKDRYTSKLVRNVGDSVLRPTL